MREAETDSHEGKRKAEALWPIFKIHHQKARFDQVVILGNCFLTIFNFRYIFDLFYRRKAISRELYDYCIKVGGGKSFRLRLMFCFQEKIADAALIAKWKKQGYENLCCLRCIQTRDTNFATNCICRVPKSKLEEGRIVECVHCGCRGCSG